MNKKRAVIIISVVVCIIIGIGLFVFFDSEFDSENDPIEIESTNLTTTYVGNTNCPNLQVKVKNTSKSTYYVYVDVNFYYKGEFVSSKSSEGVTLLAGDSYSFNIRSSKGTYLYMDNENWSFKITNIHTIKK